MRKTAHIKLLCGVATMLVAGSLTYAALSRERSTESNASFDDGATTSVVEPNLAEEALTNIVASWATPYSEAVSLVVIDRTNDATATYHADASMVSASLYKLFVAYIVLQQVDTGTVALNDVVPDTGSQTIEQCLELAITISDNTCAAGLGWLVGWDVIDTALAEDSYGGTVLNNYDVSRSIVTDKYTTAKDVALLLTRLYDGTLLDTDSTELFKKHLAAQTLNYALPTGLDPSLSFAHKTGILDEYSHDAGLLTGSGKEVIVVMMTSGWTYAYNESPPLFTSFGQEISTYMLTTQ